MGIKTQGDLDFLAAVCGPAVISGHVTLRKFLPIAGVGRLTIADGSKLSIASGGWLKLADCNRLEVAPGGCLEVATSGRLDITFGCLEVAKGGVLVIADGGLLDIDEDGWLYTSAAGQLRVAPRGKLTIGGVEVPRLNCENLAIVARLALADGALDMSYVHTCDTTHCMSGWACHALPGGQMLERQFGWHLAGMALLGWEAANHFYDGDDAARRFLKQFA